MSVAERSHVLQDLWDRVADDPSRLPPLTQTQRVELERRMAAHDANPERAIPADEVFGRLRPRQAPDR